MANVWAYRKKNVLLKLTKLCFLNSHIFVAFTAEEANESEAEQRSGDERGAPRRGALPLVPPAGGGQPEVLARALPRLLQLQRPA